MPMSGDLKLQGQPSPQGGTEQRDEEADQCGHVDKDGSRQQDLQYNQLPCFFATHRLSRLGRGAFAPLSPSRQVNEKSVRPLRD